jgi:hypothetical protein
MAIASDSDEASLWAIAVDPNLTTGTWGWLYAYQIDITNGALTYWWDSSVGTSFCGVTSATGWVATAFTEPTLANGTAYVPSICAVTGGAGPSPNCDQVPSGNIESGILVFSTCP